jgi:hypothetical protein
MKRTVRTLLLLLPSVLALVTSAPTLASGAPNGETYFLSTGGDFGIYADTVHRNVSYTFTIETGSSHEVLVREIGRSGPGLQLLIPSTWRTKRVIAPHKSISITIRYHVSDCATVPGGDWPLRLEASWSGGVWHMITVQMPNFGTSAPEWQKSIGDSVCKKSD